MLQIFVTLKKLKALICYKRGINCDRIIVLLNIDGQSLTINFIHAIHAIHAPIPVNIHHLFIIVILKCGNTIH